MSTSARRALVLVVTRGQQIKETLTVGSTDYTIQATFDDAGQVLTQTYPDGEVVANSYTAEGWLLGITSRQGSSTTSLLNNITYTGTGGASGQMTGASVAGGVYTYAASYDPLARMTDTRLTLSNNGMALFESQPSYDAAGNVNGVTTTLPGGTDIQAFCYDEQNRLTWAGSTGTPACTGTAITPGTLTGAQYQQRKPLQSIPYRSVQ